MDALAERAVAAYLGLALGDALGATVEFLTAREIAATYGVHDRIRGGGWLRLKPGQVTDDTGMSLALGEAILTARGIEATAVAQAFDRWMRSRPVDIGHTVRRGIVRFRTHGEPLAPPDEFGAGNGAAMRVLPVALATLGCPEAVVRAACRLQGRVTHNHPLSDMACECLGLMLQDALLGTSKQQILARRAAALVAEHPAFAYDGPPRLNPSGYVVETLQAVFQALERTDNFRSCLIDVVNRGGDADTTGAICGMLAGALYGLQDLPEDWLRVLDPAVAQTCRSQALALLDLAADGRRVCPSGPLEVTA